MLGFAACAALTATSSLLVAAPITYSTGFDAPAFAVGNNIPSTPPPTLNGWYRQDGTPTTTALPIVNITNVTSTGGGQSLRVQNQSPHQQLDPGSVTYAISPSLSLPGATNVIANGTPLVTIRWDMRVDDPSNLDNSSDTWALDVYDSTENIRAASIARGLDSVLGPQIYGTDATGQFNATSLGNAPASGTWGTYELVLNYLTDTYSFSLNNVLLGSRPMNGLADNGISINFTVNGRGLDVAYFDGFSVNAVPEPATIGILSLVAIPLMRRSARSRRSGR